MWSVAILFLTVVAARETAGAQEPRTFPAEGIRAMVVETQAGDIIVEAGGTEIRAEVTRPDAERCNVSLAAEGQTVVLRAAPMKRWWFGGKGCRSGFRVSVPARLRIDAATVSGRVKLTGSAGDVRVKSVSGDVALSAVTGRLELKTTSGEVKGEAASDQVTLETISGDLSLEGLTGAAAADSVSGSVRLSWAAAPTTGEVRVETISGDVKLAFPAGAAAGADVSSISGDTANELGTSDSAPLKVRASSVSGDVRIIRL